MSKRRKVKKRVKSFCIICLFLALIICAIAYVPKHFNVKENPVVKEIKEKIEEPKIKVSKVSVIATGDALIHSGVYKDAYDSTTNDYDFSKQLEYISPIVKQYDIAYYNQETPFGGASLGYSNYPRFNTPSHLGIDMQEAGFNMVSLATNHSMDKNETGAINHINFWNEQKDVLSAGMYLSEEDRNEVRIFEKNGITYSLLSYTYGTNGIPVPKGKDYLVNVWNVFDDNQYQAYKETVKADIERVRDQVDVLFVAMHWGVEYTHTPNRYQEDMAKFLAENGVDVVIGCHPHVIQPLAMIDDTLVIYSLGNMISAQEGEMKLVGMLASFDITKTEEDGNTTITIDNIGVDLTWTYYNSAYRGFKVVPFSVMDDKYLRNSENVYNKYKKIIDHPFKTEEPYKDFEINVKGYKSGLENNETNQDS